MSRLPFYALTLVGVVLLVDLALTVPSLTESVATHFDVTGRPNGWMTRTGYAIFMVALGIGLPLLISVLIPILSRWFPTGINIPNRQYWLAPSRREETLVFLKWHLGWLATLVMWFVLAIHHLVLMANTLHPAVLPHAPFFFMLGCFLVGMAVWTVLLWRRFRKPP